MSNCTRNELLEEQLIHASYEEGVALLTLFGYAWNRSNNTARLNGDKWNAYSFNMKGLWEYWHDEDWYRIGTDRESCA